MSTKERKSRVEVPTWWLEKAIPLLDSPMVNHADVARVASAHAGRKNPWGSSAISKFKDGTGRTVALTNGISVALQIPQPFLVAPTEFAAREMSAIAQRENARKAAEARKQAHSAATRQAASVIDGIVDGEIAAGLADAKRRSGVASSVHDDQGDRGVRSGRARRSRS